MKTKLVIAMLVSLCLVPSCFGQDVKRVENETNEAFAKRNAPPQSELVHTVIQTTAWNNPNSVIAFYRHEDKEGKYTVTIVDGYLFIPTSTGAYEKILINHFEEEGAPADIEAVFFANADKDPAKELVVLCSWKQQHYDFQGTMYGTFVFDDLKKDVHPAELTLLESVSKKVSGGCDCRHRDGSKPDRRFRTAAQVRAGLKRLGY